jgi:hypothetical protein
MLSPLTRVWASSQASTARVSQTVVRSPSLKGAGNLPSRTQRQIVADDTVKRPRRFGVDASSAIRVTSNPIIFSFAPLWRDRRDLNGHFCADSHD